MIKLNRNKKDSRTTRDNIIDFIHKNEMQLTKVPAGNQRAQGEDKRRISRLIYVYTVYEDNELFDYIRGKAEVDRLKNKLRQLGGAGQLELGIYEQEKLELEKMTEERNDLVKAEARPDKSD